MFWRRLPKEEKGKQAALSRLWAPYAFPITTLCFHVFQAQGSKIFTEKSVLPLYERLKPTALTILAPVSHDWFLLSLWSILSNGLAHLLWNEFSLNPFISQYTTIHLQWNRHKIKKNWMLIPRAYLRRAFSLSEKAVKNFWMSKGSFEWLFVKNCGLLKVPKLNKTIKQFLYTHIWKNNFEKYTVNESWKIN